MAARQAKRRVAVRSKGKNAPAKQPAKPANGRNGRNGQNGRNGIRGPGQPTKLTAEVQSRIVEALRAGNYAKVAAAYGGIGERTFYDWMRWGEQGKAPYSQFSQSVREAETAAEVRAVAMIQAAMSDDWRAAMTYLERRYPDRWRRHERIEHEGGERPIVLEVGARDDAEKLAAARAALAAARKALDTTA